MKGVIVQRFWRYDGSSLFRLILSFQATLIGTSGCSMTWKTLYQSLTKYAPVRSHKTTYGPAVDGRVGEVLGFHFEEISPFLVVLYVSPLMFVL